MAYFSQFPNVYAGEGIGDNESFKYRLVKNLFRRVKVREDLEEYGSLFESYTIKTGESPSQLAYRVYGDAHLDWVILLINNIIDMYEQWPKIDSELSQYVNTIYSDPDAVHHYETNKITIGEGVDEVEYVKQGTIVNSSYRVVMPDGTTKSEAESIYPVTNYEHEVYENEKKRQILMPNTTMINKVTEEFENLIGYESHVELDNSNNKLTPNNIASRFLDNVGFVTGSIAVVSTAKAADTVAQSVADALSTSTAVTTGTPSSIESLASTTVTTTSTTTTSSSSTTTSSSDSGSGGY